MRSQSWGQGTSYPVEPSPSIVGAVKLSGGAGSLLLALGTAALSGTVRGLGRVSEGRRGDGSSPPLTALFFLEQHLAAIWITRSQTLS